MVDVTVHGYISAPREEIYDYVSDLANRVAFTDHYQHDFRLAHPRSHGRGAAARWLQRPPLNKQYFEAQVVEAERPRLIVEAIHGGRGGRTRGEVVWEMLRDGTRVTRVDLTIRFEAGTPREAVKERFGTERWLRRRARTTLERLRVIFEERPSAPLARVSMAGFDPLKAPRFGVSIPGPRD